MGTKETDQSTNAAKGVVEETGEVVQYDAEKYVEVVEEMGRRRRLKRQPQTFCLIFC